MLDKRGLSSLNQTTRRIVDTIIFGIQRAWGHPHSPLLGSYFVGIFTIAVDEMRHLRWVNEAFDLLGQSRH